MFSRSNEREVTTTHDTPVTTSSRTATVARGGISWWSILTGVLVAFGVMFLLSAIAGAIIVNTGLENDIADGNAVEVGIGAGVAFVVAQLIAYLWGGYTAGRMARGSGFANGLLVPIAALVIAALVGGIAYALGETASLGLPFAENRLPVNNDALIDFGTGVGIATLAAMLLGGLLGGILGARWHTKLERNALADHEAKTVDLREGRTVSHDTHETHTAPTPTPVAAGATGSHNTAMQSPPTPHHTPPTTTSSSATTPNEAAVERHEPITTRPVGENHTTR